MKKFLAVTIALCMVLAMAACGNTANGGTTAANEPAGPSMEFTPVEGVAYREFTHSESRDEYKALKEVFEYVSDEEVGYDANDNQLYVHGIDGDGGTFENVFTYDENNNMLTWICRNSEMGLYSESYYEYENGLLVKLTEYGYESDGTKNETVHIYENDENGYPSKETITYASAGNYSSTTVHEYKYDVDGNLLYETVDSGDDYHIEYEAVYENGLVKKVTTKTIYAGDESLYTSEYEYDENGNMIRNVDTDDDRVTEYTYEYDEKGNQIKYVYDGYDHTERTMEYDENGNMIHSHSEDSDGMVTEVNIEYDSEGREIRYESIGHSDVQTSTYLMTRRYE